MASFLRSKQAGMQNDLSASILPHLFAPGEQARYGITSQTGCLTYEPVQSLLAVGTNESKFGNGVIYLFGQRRVQKVLQQPGRSSIRQVQFTANRLVSLDSKSVLSVWNLDTGGRTAHHTVSGSAIALVTDPMLDWAFLGLSNGEVVAYDLDRERISPFRLPNFWRQKDSRAQGVGLLSLQLHPRDIGQMLIVYTHGAVIYSFKQAKPIKFFEYSVPPGAPGGNGLETDSLRKPRVLDATWHPTGTFVLTAHDDGSLVFWDPKDSRIVTARSLYETKVHEPSNSQVQPRYLEPFVKIAWCCKTNPDDTGLLVCGGRANDDPEKGLTFLELGQTPVYATSSWQILADHFDAKRQQVLPTPPGADVTSFTLIPRASPYFAGAQDPIAIMVMMSSGEILTMSFPSGFPISPTNQLHPSLSLVHPYVTRFNVSTLSRERWLGMTERRNQGELLLKGGAEAKKPRRRYEGRNIIQVAHADGTIRLWDVGHGDEMENPAQLQVDVARSLNRYQDVDITAMSLSQDVGEFAAGTSSGEVVVFRWGGNRNFGRDAAKDLDPNPGGLTDISSRSETSLKEGLQPTHLYEMMQGPITALRMSDVGFLAVGSEGGFFSIIDMRGPTVIDQFSLPALAQQEKRSSFLNRRASTASKKDWPVTIEFGVMTLDDDKYSSIACFVGTHLGKVITFKLLPSGNGYTAQYAGSVSLDDKIISISPILTETGRPAAATGHSVAGLRNGQHVNGTLVVVTQTEARIFKPANSKGASKSFDDVLCDSAAVAEFELHGFALVATFGDRTTRAFSLPGLKEINKAPLAMLDATRLTSAQVTTTGDVFGFTGPSEIVIVPVWGAGAGQADRKDEPQDVMINPGLDTPPRPTISNMQWLAGTQYVSPTDLDLLVGGPDRPPSKRMMEAAAREERQAGRASSYGSGAAGGSSQYGGGGGGDGAPAEGWGSYLQRQLNERTEKLNIMGDNMDHLQDSSQGWADDVSKFVAQQKRSFVMGSIKSKFL